MENGRYYVWPIGGLNDFFVQKPRKYAGMGYVRMQTSSGFGDGCSNGDAVFKAGLRVRKKAWNMAKTIFQAFSDSIGLECQKVSV